MNRGGLNIDYANGFELESKGFDTYKTLIKYYLGASSIESSARSLIDKATGIDCLGEIQGQIKGVSLRVRNKDYNSFTLNRHISDKHSEVNKWITKRTNQIKPAYHLQFAPMPNGVKVWRIDIDAFSLFLQRQINTSNLYSYYQDRMRCYEFNYSDVSGVAGVRLFETNAKLCRTMHKL